MPPFTDPLRDPQPTHRRHAARSSAPIICEVRQGSGAWRKLSLDDLSVGGFSIARFGPADPTQPVRLRIPGLQVLSAQVAWQRDGAIGCAFSTPLYEAVFEHIVNTCR